MKTTVRKTPHAEKPNLPAYEWLVETDSGKFVAGGYCATKEDAESDMTHWLAGGSIRSAPSVINAIGRSL